VAAALDDSVVLRHRERDDLCAISLIAYWTLALVMMSRRLFTPNSRDMAFLRWGFLPLFAVTAILADFIRHE
jgi:hypothetical protein